jgi:thiol:disulfide interchange protein
MVNNNNIIAIVALVFLFILLMGGICWCNRDYFESFTNVMKTNHDTITQKIKGGKHYHAMNSNEDLVLKLKELDQHGKPALIAILADWCGHCKRLKESGTLADVAKQVNVITLDDQHPQTQSLMQNIGSKGFPTLILYNKGMKLYDGNRDSNSILSQLR